MLQTSRGAFQHNKYSLQSVKGVFVRVTGFAQFLCHIPVMVLFFLTRIEFKEDSVGYSVSFIDRLGSIDLCPYNSIIISCALFTIDRSSSGTELEMRMQVAVVW